MLQVGSLKGNIARPVKQLDLGYYPLESFATTLLKFESIDLALQTDERESDSFTIATRSCTLPETTKYSFSIFFNSFS